MSTIDPDRPYDDNRAPALGVQLAGLPPGWHHEGPPSGHPIDPDRLAEAVADLFRALVEAEPHWEGTIRRACSAGDWSVVSADDGPLHVIVGGSRIGIIARGRVERR